VSLLVTILSHPRPHATLAPGKMNSTNTSEAYVDSCSHDSGSCNASSSHDSGSCGSYVSSSYDTDDYYDSSVDPGYDPPPIGRSYTRELRFLDFKLYATLTRRMCHVLWVLLACNMAMFLFVQFMELHAAFLDNAVVGL